jgi:hypothetical protein
MKLAVLFIVIGTVWLAFRKWIARQQYRIVSEMLGGTSHDDEFRVKAFQQVGTMFCFLLILGGVAIAVLHLVTGR